MADAPAQAAYTQVGRNTPEERLRASRVVLAHAKSREDLHALLDALGLLPTTPASKATPKRAHPPTVTTTADCPINTTTEDGAQ